MMKMIGGNRRVGAVPFRLGARLKTIAPLMRPPMAGNSSKAHGRSGVVVSAQRGGSPPGEVGW